jgi:hypothetical protein
LIQKFFGNNFPHFHDAADDFVSGSKRAFDEFRECRPVSANEMQIGMADATCFHLQKNFAFLRHWTRNIFEREWLAKFVKDCSAHQTPFFSVDVISVTSQRLAYTVNYNRK